MIPMPFIIGLQSSPERFEERSGSTVSSKQLKELKGIELKKTTIREEVKSQHTVVVIASSVIETTYVMATQLLKYVPVPLLKEAALSVHSVYAIGRSVYNLVRLYIKMYQVSESNLPGDIKALALAKLKKDQIDFYEDIVLEVGKLGLRLCVLAVTVVIFMSMFSSPYGWLLAAGIGIAASSIPPLYRFARSLYFNPNSSKEIKAKVALAWNKTALYFSEKRFKMTKAWYLFSGKYQLSTGEKIDSIIEELEQKKEAFQKRKNNARILKEKLLKAGVADFKRRLKRSQVQQYEEIIGRDWKAEWENPHMTDEMKQRMNSQKEAFIKFFNVNESKWLQDEDGSYKRKKINKFFAMATQDLLDEMAISFERFEKDQKIASKITNEATSPAAAA